MVDVYSIVREILDEEGIVGIPRIIYYDFTTRLLSILAKTPEEDREKMVEALITYYKYAHMAEERVLRKIAEALTRPCS